MTAFWVSCLTFATTSYADKNSPQVLVLTAGHSSQTVPEPWIESLFSLDQEQKKLFYSMRESSTAFRERFSLDPSSQNLELAEGITTKAKDILFLVATGENKKTINQTRDIIRQASPFIDSLNQHDEVHKSILTSVLFTQGNS